MRTAMHVAGIMTGTSLDAADAVLCRMDGDNLQLLSHVQTAIPAELAATLRRINDDSSLAATMDAANALTHLCGKAFTSLKSTAAITALGCHGQTVLHQPQRGWTVQLLNGALLAEITGVDVICDFRSRDIAAGGQGAPLAPLFHRAFFAAHRPCAVVNLGGIANITVLDKTTNTRGWDIAPANMLMDAWHRQQRGGAFDRDGVWAQSGSPVPELLAELLAHPFLSLPPPKSCGREQFDLRHFVQALERHPAADAQATLLEWSAQAIAAAINQSAVTRVFLCGGGARNPTLVARIAALSAAAVKLTDTAGIAAEQVEAAAFAWLAGKFVTGTVLETPPITGARGGRLLGACYPAGKSEN